MKNIIKIIFVLFLITSLAGLTNAATPTAFVNNYEGVVTKGVSQVANNYTNVTGTYGMVYSENGVYHMYTGLCPGIRVYNSTDGSNWDAGSQIVNNGTNGTWNGTYAYCPTVWKEYANGYWYQMLFCALNGTNATVGYAYANDPCGPWFVDSEPVLINSYSYGPGAEPWGLIKVENTYYLWINNYGSPVQGERQCSLFYSTDLRHWTPDAENPIFIGQRFCPHEFVWNNQYYLMTVKQYNSVDFACIELWTSVDPSFKASTREFLGTVKMTERNSTRFDGGDLDTPCCIVTADMGARMNLGSGVYDIPYYYDVQKLGGNHNMSMFTLHPYKFTDTSMLMDSWNVSTKLPAGGYTISSAWAHSGSQSLAIKPTSNEYAAHVVHEAAGQVSLWFNESGQSHTSVILKSSNGTSAPPELCSVTISTTNTTHGKIYYTDGASTITDNFKPLYNTTYQLVIDFNTTTKLYTWQILNETGAVQQKHENLPLKTDSIGLGLLQFYATAGYTGTLYVDDLTVSNWVRTPTSTEVMNANTVSKTISLFVGAVGLVGAFCVIAVAGMMLRSLKGKEGNSIMDIVEFAPELVGLIVILIIGAAILSTMV